jgi:hypothetical protein
VYLVFLLSYAAFHYNSKLQQQGRQGHHLFSCKCLGIFLGNMIRFSKTFRQTKEIKYPTYFLSSPEAFHTKSASPKLNNNIIIYIKQIFNHILTKKFFRMAMTLKRQQTKKKKTISVCNTLGSHGAVQQFIR